MVSSWSIVGYPWKSRWQRRRKWWQSIHWQRWVAYCLRNYRSKNTVIYSAITSLIQIIHRCNCVANVFVLPEATVMKFINNIFLHLCLMILVFSLTDVDLLAAGSMLLKYVVPCWLLAGLRLVFWLFFFQVKCVLSNRVRCWSTGNDERGLQ